MSTLTSTPRTLKRQNLGESVESFNTYTDEDCHTAPSARFDSQLTRQFLYNLTSSETRTLSFQGRVYNFLERPVGWRCFIYHFAVFSMVLACLICSVLSTIKDFSASIDKTLLWMESILVAFFGTEYIIRVWAAGFQSRFRGLKGRLKFLKRPIVILDFGVCSTSLIALLLGSNEQVFATSALRIVRFMQILRLLHLDRQGSTWRLLGSVVYSHRQELITTLYIGFLLLIFSSFFMYMVERDIGNTGKDTDIRNYADALWWGVVTVTTIGYGDTVPRSWIGKIVASCFSVIAISFFALPADILGSGLALKVQQKQRQKHFNRQIPAAATLIQSLWHCYAAEAAADQFKATWSKALSSIRRLRRRKATGTGSGSSRTRADGVQPTWTKELSHHGHNKTHDDPHKMNISLESIVNSNNDFDGLFEQEKIAIRAIRRIKYFVARRKFQQTKKPYDMNDAVEQNSHGNVSLMIRIKELQRRLDNTVGKPPPNLSDKDKQQYNLKARFANLEKRIKQTDEKLNRFVSRLDEFARQELPVGLHDGLNQPTT